MVFLTYHLACCHAVIRTYIADDYKVGEEAFGYCTANGLE